MGYATIADVRKVVDDALLTQLTDDAGDGTVDTVLVDDQLGLAAVEIDGYLGSRYRLPLSTTHTILAKLCVDIAVFNLFSRRGGPPDHWQKRYDNAIQFLARVADGKISLGAGDPDGNADANTPQMTGPDRVFSRDKMRGY